MDKRRAIQIMTKAAELYRDNLEDQLDKSIDIKECYFSEEIERVIERESF